MAREHVSYTSKRFHDVAARFFREESSSIAFGVILFFSFAFTFVVPMLICSSIENIGNVDSFETSSTNGTVAFFFTELLLWILCLWAALEVADDRHWEKAGPTIWDNQKARWIEHTVICLRYLESQGKTPDTSLELSDDIYTAAHKPIDDTDEETVRPLVSALLKPPEETDTFQYEHFYSLVAKRRRIIWDYRDKKNILHSGLVDSLDEAIEEAKKFGYQSENSLNKNY